MSPHRVAPFHVWFPPAFGRVLAQQELRRLVADPGAILVDGRLVVGVGPRHDPGGIPV